MLLAIIFYNVWGVLQLVAIGSFARTLRVRTVLAGLAVGLFFCAPLAALLEYTWASAIAALTDRPIEAVIAVTSYTVDPFIEEIIRILPLALLLLVPVIRRQLSVTDCVLIGAAAGAGFGLAEDLYRFGNAPQHAVAVTGGWLAPFQSPVTSSASGRVFIPSITTAIGGWLPDIGVVRLFATYMLPNLLLIWSAVAGLAVGLWLRLDGPRRWYAAAALLVYASGAHAAYNADITFGRELARDRALPHAVRSADAHAGRGARDRVVDRSAPAGRRPARTPPRRRADRLSAGTRDSARLRGADAGFHLPGRSLRARAARVQHRTIRPWT